MTLNSPTGKDLDDEFGRLRTEYFNLSHSDFFLSIDPVERESYVKFCEARISPLSVRLMTLVIACFNIYVFSLALLNAPTQLYIALIAGSIIFIRNPFALFLMYLKAHARSGSKHWLVLKSSRWLSVGTQVCAILGSFSLGLYLIARVANGTCDSLDQYHMYGCNSEGSSHSLPQELLYCLMTLPIAYSVVFKAVSPKFVFASWVICVVTICIAIGIANAYVTIPLMVVYCPVSLILLYEIHRQNIILFRISRRQQLLLETNKKFSEESQNELRFMVANMAHDLKTVRALFVPVMVLIWFVCSLCLLL